MRKLAIASIVVIGLAALASAAMESAGSSEDVSDRLRSVSDFASIKDLDERSRALFIEAAKVITHPRCMNCHPSNRHPTQGDNMRPHIPYINAAGGEGVGMGVDGLTCSSCHRAGNTPLHGSRIGSIPGNGHWSLAPRSMGWQGHSVQYICEQLKDKARNGGRDLAAIRRHMVEDPLVGWAWDPGEGRRPAPGTQEQFGDLINAWIEAGAKCPT